MLEAFKIETTEKRALSWRLNRRLSGAVRALQGSMISVLERRVRSSSLLFSLSPTLYRWSAYHFSILFCSLRAELALIVVVE